MSTPLEKLVASGAARPLGADAIDGFLARGTPALLLVTGDVATRPEAQDVAVVAAQLARSIRGLEIGVVERAAEKAVLLRFNIAAVPALLFVRGGRVLSTLARVQPWQTYAHAAEVIFGRPEVSP